MKSDKSSSSHWDFKWVRDLLNHINDSIFIADAETGRFLEVNDKACNSLGYSREELLKMKILDIEDPALNYDVWEQRSDKIKKLGQILTKEKHKRKDSSSFPVEVSLKYVNQESGKYMIAVARDLSEREELDKKIQTLARFPAGNPNPIFLMSRNGTVLFANHASGELLDIMGMGADEVLPERYRLVAQSALDSSTTEEIEIQQKDKTYRLLVAPLSGEDSVSVYGHEISKFMKLERSIMQSEKLSAMSEVVAGMAREFANPLGVIMDFSQNLVREVQESSPYFEPLKNIERESLRCQKLMKELLTFSNIGDLKKNICDLNPAVENAVKLIAPQAKKKSIEITKEFSNEVKGAYLNTSYVEQAVLNLCNNAVESMPEGGTLSVRTFVTNNRYAVEVKDTGKGIDQETVQRVFDPFFTTKDHGKGLGLSLAYEIIQRHFGTIEVQSEVGKGSTFTIYIPSKRQDS